ncbi:MAG: aminoglycoside phosphotransferase family protein [Dehalococcoidia bacterium]
MNTALPPEVVLAVEAALPTARLEDATPLGEGWSVIAYRVPAADGDWVLRLQRRTSERVTGELEREVALVPRLEARGLPVPRAMRALHDSDGAFLGTLHRLVEGRPASEASRGERAQLAAELGAFLARLHALPFDEVRALEVPELDLWPDRYASMVEACLPLLGPRSAAWLTATVEAFRADGGTADAPRALVHGDLGPAHVRLDDTGGTEGVIAGIIDWGDAIIADPALDFATIWHGFGEPFMERVLWHYEARVGRVVDRRFRDRACFYVEVVPLFLVRYGHMFDGGDRQVGLRQLAARAAASTRRAAR